MEERMALMREDPAFELTVDGNAVGGLLATIFGSDPTGGHGECASCHTVSMVGTLRVYMRGPGVVMRCPACAEVTVRVVETPTARLVDLRGLATLRLAR